MYKKYSGSITRPNDATPFTARDVVGTATSNIIPISTAGKDGLIYRARVLDSVQTSTHTLELWLFSSPPTAQADNAAFSVSDAELLNLVGVILLNTAYATAANRVLEGDLLGMTYTGDMYAVLVVIGGTTPAANEVFTVQLDVEET